MVPWHIADTKEELILVCAKKVKVIDYTQEREGGKDGGRRITDLPHKMLILVLPLETARSFLQVSQSPWRGLLLGLGEAKLQEYSSLLYSGGGGHYPTCLRKLGKEPLNGESYYTSSSS